MSEAALPIIPSTSVDAKCSDKSTLHESYSSPQGLSTIRDLKTSNTSPPRKRSYFESSDEDSEATISPQQLRENDKEYEDEFWSPRSTKRIRTPTYPECIPAERLGSSQLWPSMFDSAPDDTGMGGVPDDWLFSWNTQQEAAALPTPAFSSTPPTLSSSLTPSVFCSPLTPCGDKDTEPQLNFDFFCFGDQSICASDFNATPSLPDQGVSPPKVRTRDMFSEVLETVNARSAVAITEASASIAQLPPSPSPDLQSGVGVMMRRGSSPHSRSRSSSASSSSSSSPSIPTQRGGQQDKKDGDGATIMVLENVGRELMSEILLVVFKSKEQPKLKLYNQ